MFIYKKFDYSQEKPNLNNKRTLMCIAVIALLLCVVITFILTGITSRKITKLKDQGDYSKIFDNVSGISVVKGEERYVVTEEQAINDVIDALESVRVKTKPINESYDANVFLENKITINGNSIYFDKNFNKLCVFSGTSPYYTYKVLNADKAKAAFEITNKNQITAIVSEITCGSDVYGLSATVKNIELNGNKPYIEVEYTNNTEQDYMNGEHFNILYKSGVKYQSCANAELFFEDIGYFLNKGQTRTQEYNLADFDFSRDGMYRFETSFGKNDLWIEFEVSNKVISGTDDKSDADLQEAEINRLREEYPQYFDLPTVNGLEVYVELLTTHPQFPTSAYCRLFAGNNLGYEYGDFEDFTGVDESEMKLILSTYKDIASSEVNIVVYYHPLSPYRVEITDGYIAQFRNKFDIYNKELDSYLHFKATVVDVCQDGTILVQAFPNDPIISKGDQFELNINGIYKNTERPIKTGDKLRIAYMGELEQAPVIKITDVRTVLLIDDGIY